MTDVVMSLVNQNAQLTEQSFQLSEQLSLVTEQNARFQEVPFPIGSATPDLIPVRV